MISLKRFPNIIMEQEPPYKQAYPSYCLHCHVKLENDKHLQAHLCHDVHSLQDAEAKLKSNLDITIAKIDAKRNYLTQLENSIEQFNESYARCKHTVKATAKELCTKIMEHEKRLIEELDMYREIELRKVAQLGLGGIQPMQQRLDTLSQTCQSLLGESDEANFLEHFKQSRESINLGMLDINTVDSDSRSIQVTIMDFSSIRCNTAFGTVSATKPKVLKRRVSLRLKDSLISMTSPSKQQPENSSPKSESESEDSTMTVTPTFYKGPKFLQRKLSLQHFTAPSRNWFFFRDVERKSPSPEIMTSPLPEEPILAPCEENEDEHDGDEHLELLWVKDCEGPEPGQINCPTDVAFLPDNTLVVCDRGNMRLQVFNTDGQTVRVISEKKIQPYRVNTTPGGQIVLTDSKDCCVKVLDKKGHTVFTLGKKSLMTSSTSFKAPCGVAQNNKKQYVVSDLESNQVALYNRDGKVQGQMDFKKPSYIATDKDGKILVSDNLNHCVKIYNSSFEYLFQCTLANQSDSDDAEDYLAYPTGCCFDNEGNIYVADWGKHTVTMFNSGGIFVKQLLSKQDGLYHPGGIAVSDGFLAVTNFSESHSSVMLYRVL